MPSSCNTLPVLPSYAKIPMLPFLHHSHTYNYPHFFLSIHWLHLVYPSLLSLFPLSLANKIHNLSSLLSIYYSGSIIYTSFYLISSLFSSLQSALPILNIGFYSSIQLRFILIVPFSINNVLIHNEMLAKKIP